MSPSMPKEWPQKPSPFSFWNTSPCLQAHLDLDKKEPELWGEQDTERKETYEKLYKRIIFKTSDTQWWRMATADGILSDF